MSAIKLDAVTKEYPNGFRAIDNVDLEIADGEFMVLGRAVPTARATRSHDGLRHPRPENVALREASGLAARGLLALVRGKFGLAQADRNRCHFDALVLADELERLLE